MSYDDTSEMRQWQDITSISLYVILVDTSAGTAWERGLKGHVQPWSYRPIQTPRDTIRVRRP